jgi:hypothetical protein
MDAARAIEVAARVGEEKDGFELARHVRRVASRGPVRELERLLPGLEATVEQRARTAIGAWIDQLVEGIRSGALGEENARHILVLHRVRTPSAEQLAIAAAAINVQARALIETLSLLREQMDAGEIRPLQLLTALDSYRRDAG